MTYDPDPFINVEWKLSNGDTMKKRIKASQYFIKPAYYGYAVPKDDEGKEV